VKPVRTALLAALLASLAAAQDPAAGGTEKVRTLGRQYQELQQKMQKDFEAIEKLPEKDRESAGDRVYGEFQKGAEAIADQVLAIATSDHSQVGFEAASAAMQMNLTKAQRATVIEQLTDHHAASAGMEAVLPRLRYMSGKTVDALLQKVVDTNPSKSAKGTASLVQAQREKNDSKREELLERVAADYADVAVGGEKLGDIAGRQLYAMRNLKIGGTPPEIVGKDMDGVAFKLSDYKGKVVVLDFYGFW